MSVQLAWLTSMLLRPPSVSTQEPIRVDDVPACPTCQIDLQHVVTLDGLGEGGEVLARYSKLALDGSGRILVAGSGRGTDRIAVFDSTGTFVRYIGRAGQGPGEYQHISSIVVGDEYVHVFDAVAGRRTMLDESFGVVRTDRVPGQVNAAAALDGDRLVFFADIPTPDLIGRPFHLLEPTGESESFGDLGEVQRGRRPRQLVGDAERGAWAIEQFRYRLQNLDPTSRSITATFVKSAGWFDADSAMTYPRATLMAVREDAAGVWIMAEVPDRSWPDRWIESRPIPPDPAREVFDGVLELVDPATGRTLAHGRWDDPFANLVAGSDLFARYREDERGVPHIDLLRPIVSAPHPSQSRR